MLGQVSRVSRNKVDGGVSGFVFRSRQSKKNPAAQGCEDGLPPVVCGLPGLSVGPLAVNIRTRFVSWLESAFSGTHPRTKGTRWFTGGYRH